MNITVRELYENAELLICIDPNNEIETAEYDATLGVRYGGKSFLILNVERFLEFANNLLDNSKAIISRASGSNIFQIAIDQLSQTMTDEEGNTISKLQY